MLEKAILSSVCTFKFCVKKEINMARLRVTTGDLTRSVSVQAIVTLINSGGMWFGGVDRAIMRLAGNFYHDQMARLGLYNGQVVIARGNHSIRRATFDDVIFVVDDLKSPLSELVYNALTRANSEGYTSVALPLMRTGVMMGVVEPNLKTVVEEMHKGIDQALADGADKMDITVVVYDNPKAVKMLSKFMKLVN
ncbi:MAG: hypothetical protein NTZ07_03805 [Candidatus Woesebacteria bacterium]|nr:hypothetical protein [Candidatus Woesebacteria bacterium]